LDIPVKGHLGKKFVDPFWTDTNPGEAAAQLHELGLQTAQRLGLWDQFDLAVAAGPLDRRSTLGSQISEQHQTPHIVEGQFRQFRTQLRPREEALYLFGQFQTHRVLTTG
jgi:hypothetical protein